MAVNVQELITQPFLMAYTNHGAHFQKAENIQYRHTSSLAFILNHEVDETPGFTG